MSGNNSAPVVVTGTGKNGPLELQAKLGVPLAKLERVWAYLVVKQLVEQYKATSDAQNRTHLQKLALDMALDYSLVTELTSLVVVKPNDTNAAVNAVDASTGIFPKSPSELPMCNNISGRHSTKTQVIPLQ